VEIGQIPGIRAVAAVKTPSVDPQLSPVFDIENIADAGDDTYSGNGNDAGGGHNDAGEIEQASEAEAQEQAPAVQPDSAVSYFA
jgi:hypothetical protein